MHSQAQVPAPQQMESIGGTTYFYTQEAQQQPAVVRAPLLLHLKIMISAPNSSFSKFPFGHLLQ